MRTQAPLLRGLVLAFAVAACGGAAVPTTIAPPPSPAISPNATASPTATVPPSPTPVPSVAPTPVDTVPPIVMSGDADTNPACQLAAPVEITTQVNAGVREMRGLTSPGAFGKTGLSCAWYLDSTDIGIPSVVVQWEFPVTTFHDAVVDLYRSIVNQKLGTRITGVGDMAILQGNTAEAIEGKRIVRVAVLQHVEPTEKDNQDAIALLRLFLERTAPE